jgi:hypothetical protein
MRKSVADQTEFAITYFTARRLFYGFTTSTTLAELFTPLCAANPFSAVWASLRW